MAGVRQRFEAAEADPRVAGQARDGRPTLLFDRSGTRILWANAAGLAYMGERSVAGLLSREIPAESPFARRLAILGGQLSAGQSRTERIALPKGLLPSPVVCVASRTAAGDGRGLLLTIVDGSGRLDPARAAAGHDAIRAELAAIDGPRPAESAEPAANPTAAGDQDDLSAAPWTDALAAPEPASVAAEPASIAAPVAEPPSALPGAAEPEPAADAAPAVSRFEPPAHGRGLRFLFELDDDLTVTFLSPELSEAVGAVSAGIVGRRWPEASRSLGLDPAGRVEVALSRRDTFTGVTVEWPVDDQPLRMPVSLAGMPVFGRDRSFRGYRGFGIARTGAVFAAPFAAIGAIPAPAPDVESDLAVSEAPALVSDIEAEIVVDTPATGSAPTTAEAAGQSPAGLPVPDEARAHQLSDMEAASRRSDDSVGSDSAVEDDLGRDWAASAPAEDGGAPRPEDTPNAPSTDPLPPAPRPAEMPSPPAEEAEPTVPEAPAPPPLEVPEHEPVAPDAAPSPLPDEIAPRPTVESGPLPEEAPAGTPDEAPFDPPAEAPGGLPAEQTPTVGMADAATAGPVAPYAAEVPVEGDFIPSPEISAWAYGAAYAAAEAERRHYAQLGVELPPPAETAPLPHSDETAEEDWRPADGDAGTVVETPFESGPPDFSAFDSPPADSAGDTDAILTIFPLDSGAPTHWTFDGVADPAADEAASETDDRLPEAPDASRPAERTADIDGSEPADAGDAETTPGADRAAEPATVPGLAATADEATEGDPAGGGDAQDSAEDAEDVTWTHHSGGEVILSPIVARPIPPRSAEGLAEDERRRLSKPEREAFQKIAEALGARLDEVAGAPAMVVTAPDAREPAAETQPVAPGLPRLDTALFEKLPIALAILRDGEAVQVNRAFLDLTGYASLADLTRAGGFAEAFAGTALPRDTSAPSIRRRDGVEIPVRAQLHSLALDDGIASLMVLREVAETTGRSRAQQAEARVEELEAILDTATDGVLVLDTLGVVLGANRSAEALFGAPRSAMTGLPLVDLLAPESHRNAIDYLDGLTRNGVASVLNDGREVIGRVAQGGLVPLFMTIGRVSSQKFCAVLRDITQWKRAEEELTNAKRSAENASSQKSDFLAKISHEIRTPLNAIIGFSEVMMEEAFGPVGNDRYKEYLRDIHMSGAHIMSLVNDLLDLSKIEAGKLDLSFEAVALNEVVRECVALMQPQANRERIIIRTSLSSTLPNVVADSRSLRQIVLNLLSNALKFNSSGGQVIVSTLYEQTGEVVFRVRDTGPGMSEEDIGKALEPFRQLHTARPGRGTGLGLPLTKALVEANRAGFRIDSALGQGTLVQVTFPSTRVLAE